MSAQSGSRFRRQVALLALLLIVFSAILVYVPGVLPANLVQTVQEVTRVDPQTTLLFVGAAAGIIGLLTLWVWRVDGQSERLADTAAEVPDRDMTLAGTDLTEAFKRQKTGTGVSTAHDDGPLADALHDVLVETYNYELGDRENAKRYVDEGCWTTDRYAVAFVTAETSVDYPFYFRLLAWLYPGEAYKYRAKRALREVEATCEAELPNYEAPDRDAGWRVRLLSLVRRKGGN